METRKTRVTKHLLIERGCADILWNIYAPNIARIQAGTPFRQGLTKNEFDAAMSDQSFLKFILRVDDDIVGFTVIATDVAKITWLSTEFFQHNYPRCVTRYLVALAVGDQHSLSSIFGSRQMIQAVAEDTPQDAVLFYDFSRSLHFSLSHFGPSMARRTVGGQAKMIDSLELWEAKY